MILTALDIIAIEEQPRRRERVHVGHDNGVFVVKVIDTLSVGVDELAFANSDPNQ